MLRDRAAERPVAARARHPEAQPASPAQGSRNAAHTVLLGLPLLMLMGQMVEPSGALGLALGLLAVPVLLVTPGYALLCVLRLGPLAAGAGLSTRVLVVPLSLAVDVLLGTVLVISPARLTAASLSAGLSVLSVGALLWVRRP